MGKEKWATEQNATFIRVYDVEAESEEERETYYLKSGAQGRWNKTTKNMFEFVIIRDKGQASKRLQLRLEILVKDSKSRGTRTTRFLLPPVWGHTSSSMPLALLITPIRRYR
jgi:hypothetical protein